MTAPPLIDWSGQPFPLGRQLASGGEGAVFTLPNDAERLAKVYHNNHFEKAEKLRLMISLPNPQLVKVTAWPERLLFHAQTRQIIGFIMPRLSEDYQRIQHLFNPKMREKYFPRAGWAFQLRAARNLAAAFDEVHKAGYLVGDVSDQNVFVSQQAMVRLIDCDSFQIRSNGQRNLCNMGTPFYIPPELLGGNISGEMRTENHDRFGMAVLIYKLLFVGREPYAGIYHGSGDPTPEEKIRDFLFAQGPQARSWGVSPPPHAPTFADIPPDVGLLFRRAFERGSEKGGRPRACEWVSVLQQLGQNSTKCAVDAGHEYWHGAGSCVWCRLAANGGPEYYFGIDPGCGTFEVDNEKLQEVLRRLAAERRIEFCYDRNKYASAEQPKPLPIPRSITKLLEFNEEASDDDDDCVTETDRKTYETITNRLAVATLVGCAVMALGTIRISFLLLGMVTIAVFGILLAIHLYKSPDAQSRRRAEIRRQLKKDIRRRSTREYYHRLMIEADRREQLFRMTVTRLENLEQRWHEQVNHYYQQHQKGTEAVSKLVAECRGLATEYQRVLHLAAQSTEETARLRHLRFHLLADADIPYINTARKQILASLGIVTAADIEWSRIDGMKRITRNGIKIEGYEEALSARLIAWKEEVLSTFRFDPSAAISPAEQKAVTNRLRTRQQQILIDLDRMLTELKWLTPVCQTALQKLEPDLKIAFEACRQAYADRRVAFAACKQANANPKIRRLVGN